VVGGRHRGAVADRLQSVFPAARRGLAYVSRWPRLCEADAVPGSSHPTVTVDFGLTICSRSAFIPNVSSR
jgi:hypothetical protein